MEERASRTALGTASRNQTWFEGVFNEHYNELAAYVRRYVGSDDLADDILQDLFISIWRDLDRWIDAGDALRPLLFVAARNRAFDHLRAVKVRERHARSVVALEDHEATSPEADDALLQREIQALLDAAVAKLPPRARQIFLLSREEGLTYREIARRLRLSPKTVENQMGIALSRLRSTLTGYLALLISLSLK